MAMAVAANSDGPEKSIAEVQYIVWSPCASASVKDDTLFGHDLHISTNPDLAADDEERSEAKVRLDAADDEERSEANVRLDAAEKVILRLYPSIRGSLVEVSAREYLSAVDHYFARKVQPEPRADMSRLYRVRLVAGTCFGPFGGLARGEAMVAAANSDGPEKSIAEVQHIVESPFASASVEDDTLFGHDLHISTNPDLADNDDERSEAKVLLDAAGKVILRLDPSIRGSLVEGSAGEYLFAVDEIIFLSVGGVDGEARSHATNLLKIAMSDLIKVFYHIISVQSANLDADRRSFQSFSRSMPSEYSDPTTEDSSTWMEEELHAAEERGWYSLSDQSSNRIPSEVISELKEIADRMTAAGYQQELCQAYISVRQHFLNEFLFVLQADQLSIEHAETFEWATLREMVVKWTRRLNRFVSILLPWERELCAQIFVASDELKEVSFRETARGSVLRLLDLGDVFATRLQSHKEVFPLLDIYEAFSDLQILFSGDPDEYICRKVEQIVERLGRKVRGTLAYFENEIGNARFWKQWPDGQIDPLVRYVMNYLTKLVRYSSSLNLLLHDDGVDGGDDSVRDESMTPFGQRTHAFMSLPECRIQEISKRYTHDDALKYIFLMNNILCMVVKVEGSELKALLGDDWVRTRRIQIEQYATCYLRASWSKPLSYLKDDGLFFRRGGSSMVALKGKLKNFNLAFEEIWNTQKAWIVPDPQLREDLRLLILTAVIPGYRTFLGTYGDQLEGVQQISKHLKYTPEDLEDLLSDLFEGTILLENLARNR